MIISFDGNTKKLSEMKKNNHILVSGRRDYATNLWYLHN